MNIRLAFTTLALCASVSSIRGATERITDLSATATSNTSVLLEWTVPISKQTLVSYDIRMGLVPITALNWGNQTLLPGIPLPGAMGESQEFTITNLAPGTTYYFAIKTLDVSAQWSLISNLELVTTDIAFLPPPGSTLTDALTGIQPFSWSPIANALEYWIQIGSSVGAHDIGGASIGTNLSVNATVIPVDGRNLYLRFWWRIGVVWDYQDMQYKAPLSPLSLTTPAPNIQFITPANGSTLLEALETGLQTFDWNPVIDATQYYVYLGSKLGYRDLYDATAGFNSDATIASIPRDGRALFMRVWYQVNSVWKSQDFTYTSPLASISWVTPEPGTLLIRDAGTGTTFSWSPVTSATEYWLHAGGSLGANNIFDASAGTNTTQVVPIPANGSEIFLRIWYRVTSTWKSQDYTYLAPPLSGDEPSLITSITPPPGSVLETSQTFSWNPVAFATKYWVYLGIARGDRSLYNGGTTKTATSVSIKNIPRNNNPIYLRVWYFVGSSWEFDDFEYIAPAPLIPSVGPGEGSILRDAFRGAQEFSWNAVTGVSEYWLYVGSTFGARDILSSSLGSNTSISVSSIPKDGRTIYVRLWCRMSDGWKYQDFSFKAPVTRTVKVAWDPNPETNIAGYRVYYLPEGSGQVVLDVGNVTKTDTIEVEGGVHHEFYVTAYNTFGLESDPSETLEYTPPGP